MLELIAKIKTNKVLNDTGPKGRGNIRVMAELKADSNNDREANSFKNFMCGSLRQRKGYTGNSKMDK